MTNLEWTTTSADVKMPCIVYGTAWKKERTANLVETAVRAGFRGIDTACQPRHYSEPGVGDALGRLEEHGIGRADLFLQTKFTPIGGQDPETAPYDKDAPLATQVAQSFAVSQKNLSTDYVDSLVLHSPLGTHEETMEAWGAMENVHHAGGAKQLGISNCYDLEVMQKLHQDAAVKPAVLQNRFYRETGHDAELRRWCDGNAVTYQSFWTLTANKDVLAGDAVKAIAQVHGKTEAQVFFRYLTHLGIVPLTGTTSEEHMKADLAIFTIELTPDEVARVTSLLSQE